MTHSIRFCLVLHNHQPIGNFDNVFEQAYQDSYLPFLEVFEPYEALQISLHTSGPLMEWLDRHHPEYLDRLSALVRAGRVEIVGGAYYEPILAMLPGRDRVGQIREYSKWLADRFETDIQGMWVPERVWEQSITRDIRDADIKYTVLDDYHFRNAGLEPEALHGFFATEDEGRLLNVFPGSERLRYLIPFADPQETINYLGEINQHHRDAVLVFGDDGEKFGTWPDTKKHVYEDGWLRRFFDALVENRHWIQTTTLRNATSALSSQGKIYLPDSSYREMTEWSLPVDQQINQEKLVHELQHEERWHRVQRFMRGGFWRNFKVKYPESNEMYARMMQVSQRIEQLESTHADSEHWQQARQALYRGQCNCSYWHGAFGGIYLPHLRNAVYSQLIQADNLLDRTENRSSVYVEATADDFNFDGQTEVRLSNDKLIGFFAPSQGGQLYELDLRSISHNLLATLARRPESYHQKVLAGPSQHGDEVASIHDRVVFKQEGLDQRVHYDNQLRKSFMDHFFDPETTPESIQRGEATEHGDFLTGAYDAKIRRNPDRIQVLLCRDGNVDGEQFRITKGITAAAGSQSLDIAYLLENLPSHRTFHFASEWNFAGMPSNADDRYFFLADDEMLGHLGSVLNLQATDQLGLADDWLGVQVRFGFQKATNIWTFPIESVSQSEGGYELVHQSVVVMPHWNVRADAEGRWSTRFRLDLKTAAMETSLSPAAEATQQFSP